MDIMLNTESKIFLFKLKLLYCRQKNIHSSNKHIHTTRQQVNANDNLPDKNGSLEIYRKTKQYRRKNQGECSGCSIMYLLYHLTLSICP